MNEQLVVRNLKGGYGKSQILQGMDFSVAAGETVALLGRNGVGKTTTMRAITGLLGKVEGEVLFEGNSLVGQPTHIIAKRGLALVPEHRGVFGTLTVEENLKLAARKGARWSVNDVLEQFPAIARRRETPGGKLSGGEQQLLSIGRALVTGPSLLLLDEPTEGLAPIIVDQLVNLMRTLKDSGLSIVVVEQSLEVCQKVADRLLIVDHGVVAWGGTVSDLAANPHVKSTYLTLEHA